MNFEIYGDTVIMVNLLLGVLSDLRYRNCWGTDASIFWIEDDWIIFAHNSEYTVQFNTVP